MKKCEPRTILSFLIAFAIMGSIAIYMPILLKQKIDNLVEKQKHNFMVELGTYLAKDTVNINEIEAVLNNKDYVLDIEQKKIVLSTKSEASSYISLFELTDKKTVKEYRVQMPLKIGATTHNNIKNVIFYASDVEVFMHDGKIIRFDDKVKSTTFLREST
jgi:hypothetical protein